MVKLKKTDELKPVHFPTPLLTDTNSLFWHCSRTLILLVYCRLFVTFLAFSPSTPCSAVAGDYWILVRPSVNSLVHFYSALDLPYYWEESIETLHSARIDVAVVHLGKAFIKRRKCAFWT